MLNVFWEAYYYPSSNSNLIATCYLNCPAPPCTAYKSCSLTYPGLEGEKSCSITEPDYHMTPGTLSPDSASTVTNLVNCVFTDTIRGRDTWQSLNFYPLAFYLNVPSAVSMTVGDQTPLEIEVKNLGILTDSYSFDLSSTEPTLLQVSRGQSTISNVPADNMDSKTADMFLLSTQQIVEAELAFSSMTAPEIKITPDKRIRVGGGMKSLPDFGLLGIVQIIAIAALLLFKLK